MSESESGAAGQRNAATQEQSAAQTIMDREEQMISELGIILERVTNTADRLQGPQPAPVDDTAKGEPSGSSFQGDIHRCLDRQFELTERIRQQVARLESFI